MLKQVFGNTKSRVAMLCVAMMMIASNAFAASTGIDTSAVTGTFADIAKTVLVVIGAVAATAVGIMGIILAWKYGRKMFGMLAK
ncbi:hypothetical protein [Paenibacillus amylolyticus]|uniref:hypothetical protein n=1 Tax=Paenibacillus amylolyticus TaxID=1451 RepID=UPI00201E6747|nr:hypothetical protein [Paenibacillus amylolyticus]MCL6664556.1 hypothetical protein [Paenibacillus amylolyticus]